MKQDALESLSHHSGTFGHPAAWTTVFAAAICLLIASPAVNGATPGGAPPFKGSSAVSLTSTTARCGSATGSMAKWAPFSGKITAASKDTGHGCPVRLSQYSGATSQHAITVAFPISTPTTSLYNVSMNLSYGLNNALALNPGSCRASVNYTYGWDYNVCDAYTDWSALVTMSLWDASTGIQVPTSYSSLYLVNDSYNFTQNTCRLGTCTNYYTAGVYPTGSSTYQNPSGDTASGTPGGGSVSGTTTLWLNTSTWWPTYGAGTNSTLLSSDHYMLVVAVSLTTTIYLVAYESFYTGFYSLFRWLPSPATASGSISALTSAGGGFVIQSLVATAVP
ncbi:MAG: hypothetical protein ACHQ2Y_05080 [Candidatus Lutacidiplasmatales archaeon]